MLTIEQSQSPVISKQHRRAYSKPYMEPDEMIQIQETQNDSGSNESFNLYLSKPTTPCTPTKTISSQLSHSTTASKTNSPKKNNKDCVIC